MRLPGLAGAEIGVPRPRNGVPPDAAPPDAAPAAAAPRRVTSLTLRLALSVSLVLAAGGAGVAVAALAYGRHAAELAYDRLLIGAADQIAGSLSVSEGTIRADIPISAFELLALAPADRVVYAILAPDGHLVTGYPGFAPPPDGATFAQGSFSGEAIRLATVRRQFSERGFSGTVTVLVGQTMRARSDLAREITRSALIVVGVVGLLMSGLAAFAIRSALAPLRRIERGLALREPRDLTPLDVEVPREIGHLVGAINRFMERQGRQFAIMRNVIADASHQLRTPVAGLRAQADLAADESDPARQRAIVARIHSRAVGLSRLTDQLLNHALIIHRVDAVPREIVDLRTIAIRTVEESDHELFASDTELRLNLPEDPLWCRCDALSLVEACKNLVNNAFRYGGAPVTLEVRAEPPFLVIGVRDSGPGLPEADWADAGARYDRTTGVSQRSASLGLAIVTAVARAHDGRVRFGRTPGGDFEVVLLFPDQVPPVATTGLE